MPKHLYFIALVPGPELREQVRLLKLVMKDRFHASHALKAPAHITLQMPFRREQEFEKQLISCLKSFSLQQHRFMVRLNGFDAFPPRVLFVKVENHIPIAELHQSLQLILREQLEFNTGELQQRFHPHMTIATRDLSKPNFKKAWKVFKGRDFEAAFEANELCLLKHNGQNWDMYKTFGFAGQ